MKSITTIALSFYFLLAGFVPNIDFHELAKLPTLVKHFLDCEANSSESLLTFINNHYDSDDQKTPSHQDEHDGKLPFQCRHSCHTCHMFIAVSSFPLTYFGMELKENTFFDYQYIISSEYLNSIFHPPKA